MREIRDTVVKMAVVGILAFSTKKMISAESVDMTFAFCSVQPTSF